jgi:dynein heavy chain
MLNQYVTNKYNIMLAGESGSGKTSIIDTFMKSLDTLLYVKTQLSFTAQTTEINVMDVFKDKVSFQVKNNKIVK